jgi:hypothetical protein
MRLNVKAFALSCGLIWGIGVFFLTWWIMAFEGPTHDPMIIGHVYRGYVVSPLGSVIGLAWAFADGLIGGALFAWLYNLLANPRGTMRHDVDGYDRADTAEKVASS